MLMATSLFNEFPLATKADWLAQLAKDLKGKPFTDLQWHLGNDLVVDPLYHPEDGPFTRSAIGHNRPGNNWELSEFYEVEDPQAANAAILEGLNGGVQSIGLKLQRPFNAAELQVVLAGVDLRIVSTHLGECYSDKQPQALLANFLTTARAMGAPLANLRGSINFDPFLDWPKPPMPLLQALLQEVQEHLPQFRVLRLNGRYYHGPVEHTAHELALILAKGSEYLFRLGQAGIDPATVNRFLQFSVSIGRSYFVEIAKLRALRLLWANVLQAYGVSGGGAAEITVFFARDAQDEHPHTNMIRAATQAMAAVIGGADRLYVLPANAALNEPSTPFYRRIARNVQHLLALESHLDKVIDPAAGSYYLEKLTDQLAQQAWARFQDLEKKGEFAF